MWKCGITFAVFNIKVYKLYSQNSHNYINFNSLQYFAMKLHNFTQFKMLFPAVVINFDF